MNNPQPTPSPMEDSRELRETLELFRKQCMNKGDGIGFEETIHRLLRDRRKSDIRAIIDELEIVRDIPGKNLYVVDRLAGLKAQLQQLESEE